MWTKPTNPTVIKLTETVRKRRKNLTPIKAPIGEDRKALCAWCVGPLRGKQRKWCGASCSDSAYAWANPQSEYGLAHLLARQGFKCVSCNYDWNPLAQSLLGTRGIPKGLDKLTQFNIRLIKALKRNSPIGTKPEVDHIHPIARGGNALGHDNHQGICTQCHKAKSKVDNSGPRSKCVRKKKGKEGISKCFCQICVPKIALPGII
jgi:5-methylcytosine-specific restriction endonuclease McrA